MRMLARIGLFAVPLAGLVVAGCLAVSATGSTPPDLIQSYYIGPSGKGGPLRAGATYQASLFPIAIRIKTPGPGWSGAQWKSGSDYFRGGSPPNYGWVHLARGPANGIPQGLISIMTGYTRTPPVAKTVTVLRTRGRGASYEPTSPASLAGFAGVQFDGQITGAKNVDHFGHFFIPFSRSRHSAGYFPDEYPVYGDVFRVIVLDVRGKTVVIYIENVGLSYQRFPQFLSKAQQILGALRFPAGAK
jgi:hypothetical protein